MLVITSNKLVRQFRTSFPFVICRTGVMEILLHFLL